MKRQSQYFYAETEISSNEDEKQMISKSARVEMAPNDVSSSNLSTIKSADDVVDKENTQNECSYAFACIEEIVSSTHTEFGSTKTVTIL